MKVKTRQELSDMDEDLNLFDESDWSFLDVQDGDSLEYFNDIRDTDFRRRTKGDILKYFIVTLSMCSLLISSGVWLYNVTIGRHLLSDEDASSTNDRIVPLQRVSDASKVSSNAFIEISKVVSSYFNVLESEGSYDKLNNICLTSSTFYDTEKSYRENMEYSFDSSDSYSRALRCFGKYFCVSRINEILYKDGIYYVYASLNYPDNNSLTEYFYIYSNDMSKFFTTYEVTEQNIVRYILQLSDTYGIPTSSKEVCIEVCEKSPNEFVFIDDSFVTSQCTTSYNYAIAQAVKILGAYKATSQY